MVVDAPCSGEGLFRKDPNAMSEWSPDNVALCSKRQRRILSDVWPALKQGGILIYSTCTYNEAENEENLAWLKNTQIMEKGSGDHSGNPFTFNFKNQNIIFFDVPSSSYKRVLFYHTGGKRNRFLFLENETK